MAARTRRDFFRRRDHQRLLSNRWNERRLSISEQLEQILGRKGSFLEHGALAERLWRTRNDL